jgi:hypothetical protein
MCRCRAQYCTGQKHEQRRDPCKGGPPRPQAPLSRATMREYRAPGRNNERANGLTPISLVLSDEGGSLPHDHFGSPAGSVSPRSLRLPFHNGSALIDARWMSFEPRTGPVSFSLCLSNPRQSYHEFRSNAPPKFAGCSSERPGMEAISPPGTTAPVPWLYHAPVPQAVVPHSPKRVHTWSDALLAHDHAAGGASEEGRAAAAAGRHAGTAPPTAQYPARVTIPASLVHIAQDQAAGGAIEPGRHAGTAPTNAQHPL